MAPLTIYRDNYMDSTVVSNRFIDDYMTEANDAQLKVYFYLIRMLNANQAVSVSGIADKFNHTEKDVIRALKYWEKRQILDLDYDCNKNLTGVHLRDLSAVPVQKDTAQQSIAVPASGVPTIPVQPVVTVPAAPFAAPVQAEPALQPELPTFVKPSYSLDQLKEFKDREDTAQLLFVAESYIGKPLTPSEIKTILFFTDVLHFSEDLIDYLIQYCVERGKKDFKYIEKVAVNWAEEGVTTPKQAQQYATRYDKNVYAIMNELGKKNSPTSKEIEYINRWTKEYGFTTDIILEACERTVLATDRHRFEYAEGILSSWKRENVHHKADIHRIDKLYQKKKTTASANTGSNVSNKFNQFTQNSYDFEALERELLSN
ncbi:MAG: DnaD domain protein [Lachnospiraceae bacterium]|nr:DnaD domain protein [Lachnospiraceae bacterium]